MKKYLSGLLTGIIIMLSITVFADTTIQNAFFTNDIKLKVNGQQKDVTFVNVDGTNYAKVRDIVSAVGGVAAWDAGNKTIVVSTVSQIPATTSIEPTPTPILEVNNMDMSGWYKLKSDLGIFENGSTIEYVVKNGEGYIQVGEFGYGRYLNVSKDTIIISLPEKPQLTIERSNIGNDGKTINENGRTYIKLSALDLKATINGDTLTIE